MKGDTLWKTEFCSLPWGKVEGGQNGQQILLSYTGFLNNLYIVIFEEGNARFLAFPSKFNASGRWWGQEGAICQAGGMNWCDFNTICRHAKFNHKRNDVIFKVTVEVHRRWLDYWCSKKWRRWSSFLPIFFSHGFKFLCSCMEKDSRICHPKICHYDILTLMLQASEIQQMQREALSELPLSA